MIGRLRLRSGVYLSAILLLAGLSLAAQGAQAVTRAEMESFVLMSIAGAGVAVVGAFWLLLTSLLGRAERSLESSVGRLEHSVDRLVTSLAAHNVDPLAHTAAAEHNHAPISAAMHVIEAKLDVLIEEHCAITGRCPGGRGE